jgi:hypothetical protein
MAIDASVGRFYGVQAKIDRAGKHIEEIGSEIRAFRERQPYRIKIEGRDHRLQIVEQPNPLWALIIGDAVHNMRSALDHLAWQLVEAGGGTSGWATQFPITPKAESLENEISRRVAGASSVAIEAIRRTKPYQGGNDDLWTIHNLDIYDKHRLTFVVTSRERGVRMRHGFGEVWAEVELLSADRRCDLKDGDVVFTGPIREEFESPLGGGPIVATEFRPTLEVAFAYGSIDQCFPVMEKLTQLVTSIEEVCRSFKPFLN